MTDKKLKEMCWDGLAILNEWMFELANISIFLLRPLYVYGDCDEQICNVLKKGQVGI